jgi:hypothetical protein
MSDNPHDDGDQFHAIDDLIDSIVSEPTKPSLESAGRSTEPLIDASNDVDIVMRGNLPLAGFIWPPQYVKRLALEGGTSALVEMDEGTCKLMVFFSDPEDPALHTLPPVLATIDEAVDWLAANVRHLVVVPGHTESIDSYIGLEEHLILFTGADDPAVVAAYKLLARAVDSSKEVECRKPRTRLVFFGAQLDKARSAADRIERTAKRFMGAKVRWNDFCLQRVSDLHPFAGHDVPVPGGFGTRELVEQFRAARKEFIDGMNSGRADRWNDEQTSTADGHLEAPAPIEPTPPESAPRYPAVTEVDIDISKPEHPAATIEPDDRDERELEQIFVEDERIRAEEAKGLSDSEDAFHAPPEPTDHEPRPEPKAAAPAAPGVLLRLFPELRPVPVPLSIDPRIEAAVDAAGRLHLLASEEQLRLLRIAESSVRRNEPLIARAIETPAFDSGGLQLDVVVRDAAGNSDLHGSGLNLYLLLPAPIGGRHVMPLNNEHTARGL